MSVRRDGVQFVCGILLSTHGAPRHGGVSVSLALNILLHTLLYLHRLPVLVVVDDEEVLALGVDGLLRKYLTPHRTAGSLLGTTQGSGLEQSGLDSSVEYFLLDESVLSEIMVHTTARIVRDQLTELPTARTGRNFIRKPRRVREPDRAVRLSEDGGEEGEGETECED